MDSGIAIEERIRAGARGATKAGWLQALADWRRERDAQIAELGPKPSWFRPFARRRWQRSYKAINAVDINWTNLQLRVMYDPAELEALAGRPHPLLSALRKRPSNGYYVRAVSYEPKGEP